MHFNGLRESNLEPFINNLRPFVTPVTKDEVAKIILNLWSNTAPEYHQMPPELPRYAPPEVHDLIAESCYSIFAKHEYINDVHGLLIALQKPRKQKGPTKSLCPVILLIMLWNVVSNVVLFGIQITVKKCLSRSQSAYWQCKSTSWCHKFLAAPAHVQSSSKKSWSLV